IVTNTPPTLVQPSPQELLEVGNTGFDSDNLYPGWSFQFIATHLEVKASEDYQAGESI
ncbi:hypothetical protein L7F22_057172, partial [Adiantum nelumboides]|nr:hypothetical protein [Adiantum nelumboides]